jgi:hypothetical protein
VPSADHPTPHSPPGQEPIPCPPPGFGNFLVTSA